MSIVLIEQVEMAVDGAKVAQAFPKWPIRMTMCMIVAAHLVEQFPMAKDLCMGLPQAHATVIHVAWRGSSAIIFKN